MTPPAPVLAVAIPSRNRPAGLAALLTAVGTQAAEAGQPVPVAVGDDASEPPVRVPAGVRLVRAATPRGPAAARNAAWRATGSGWVWFLDDDVVPAPGSLAAILAAIASAPPEVGILEGPVRSLIDPADRRPHPLAPRLPEGGPAHRMTAGIVYRRAALDAVGGFDERFARAACEDFDLAFRVEDAGWRHQFVEGAAAGHPVHAPLRLRAWLARQRWRREAVVRLYTGHPRRFDPGWMGAAARLVHRAGAPITPATWARFFVLEAVFEAWAGRPAWWDVGRVAVAGAAAVGTAAGAVRDYVAGVFDGSRYST